MLYTNPPRLEKKPLCKASRRLPTRTRGGAGSLFYNEPAARFTERLLGYLEGVISGDRRGFFSAVLRFELLQISWISLGIMRLRRWLYSKCILRVRHLPCKVMSVGNVVVGGSGKTPAVIAVAKLLGHTGSGLAILSRGYRSRARKPAVVSDTENIFLSPAETGDEPYLISRSLPGVPVLIGKDRIQTGFMAIRRWNSRIVILDDGFQYLKLARDIDIVTIDATQPFGFDHILPRGYLREPLSVLNEADLILLTRVDQCENLDFVRDKLSRIAPSVPIFESIYEPRLLRSLYTKQEIDPDTIRGKNVLAVCGIANPLSFARTLKTLGTAELSLLPFPDHHAYPPSSIEMIRRKAVESGAEIIITTEKDAPKFGVIAEYPVLSLIVDLKLVGPAAEKFTEFIQGAIGFSKL